ncbi:MAG TPA: M15 family metallopeptidase [Steroidobacteraceae bacterium]|nr:M15 family metallopeptidase [Steroidobacteraceae bacterium]
MNELELTGRTRTHIVDVDDPGCALHRDTVQPFLDLRAAAVAAGIDLVPVSSFRDFDAQRRIWNEKYRGKRTLYDRFGHALDHSTLGESGLIDAILRWSALPGASRHHWGTDIDVIDRGALPDPRSVKLLPVEFGPNGPFARLNAWLDENMQRFGFFRPYRTDRGGVSPEPWHLSHAPVAEGALRALTESVLRSALESAEVDGKAELLCRLGEISARYVTSVDAPGSRYA